MGPPLGLVTSEVTARSFQVSWSAAPGSVEKYRVVYYPSHGGEPQEVHPVLFCFFASYTHCTLCQFYWGKAEKASKVWAHLSQYRAKKYTRRYKLCCRSRSTKRRVKARVCVGLFVFFPIIFATSMGVTGLRPAGQEWDELSVLHPFFSFSSLLSHSKHLLRLSRTDTAADSDTCPTVSAHPTTESIKSCAQLDLQGPDGLERCVGTPFQLAQPESDMYHKCHPFRTEWKILFCFRHLH